VALDLGILRSIAPVKSVSGRNDLVGERRECDLDTPLGIVVKHEVRKIDQSIAEALHDSEQMIEIFRGLVGRQTVDLSHHLLESRNGGHKRILVSTDGEFDDLCGHARVPCLLQAAADAARQSLRTARRVRCNQVLMVPTGTPKRRDKLARLSPSR
jgi:hypothetical protein